MHTSAPWQKANTEFQLERYCSGKVGNDREYKAADENAISTLNIALLQQDCNEMIKWLLAEGRQRIESSRKDKREQSFLCYSKVWKKTNSIFPHMNEFRPCIINFKREMSIPQVLTQLSDYIKKNKKKKGIKYSHGRFARVGIRDLLRTCRLDVVHYPYLPFRIQELLACQY